MGWLGLVNWSTVNRGFCLIIWAVALVLAGFLLMHFCGATAPAHHGSPLAH
jgi:hypothetical protein